jgi:hypothetical protein
VGGEIVGERGGENKLRKEETVPETERRAESPVSSTASPPTKTMSDVWGGGPPCSMTFMNCFVRSDDATVPAFRATFGVERAQGTMESNKR